MTTIIKSILAINPTAQVSVSGDDVKARYNQFKIEQQNRLR